MKELTVEEMALIYGGGQQCGSGAYQSGNNQISVGNANVAASANVSILSYGVQQNSGDANAGNQSIG
jgi:bacteriocin-like protein